MKRAPMGDPLEIRLRGYELTLRADDAAHIAIDQVHDAHDRPRTRERLEAAPHPAIGEKYAPRAAGTAIPEGRPLKLALAGNQNCGKTTLFNALTGSNQHRGQLPRRHR